MRGAIAIAVYVVAGFLTFGHVFNANYVAPTPVIDCGDKPDVLKDYEGNRAWYDCERKRIDAKYSGTTYFEAAFPAVYAAIGWPVYWGGKLAIKVTK